jgi:hypothetical protein
MARALRLVERNEFDHEILVLQGGGALGAYQAGVYEGLVEAGREPTWVVGISIGGINAALIAGNPPERRVERLREFWRRIATHEGLNVVCSVEVDLGPTGSSNSLSSDNGISMSRIVPSQHPATSAAKSDAKVPEIGLKSNFVLASDVPLFLQERRSFRIGVGVNCVHCGVHLAFARCCGSARA